jgi:hypothetical protein
MRLDLLAQLLQDAGVGTIGEDIFVHRMDADTVRGVLLREPLDGVPVDANIPDYFKHNIQVIVREVDQAAGDALATRTRKALTFYNREFLDNANVLQMKVNQLYPRTLPRPYPRLQGDGIEWSMDMFANYVMPVQ